MMDSAESCNGTPPSNMDDCLNAQPFSRLTFGICCGICIMWCHDVHILSTNDESARQNTSALWLCVGTVEVYRKWVEWASEGGVFGGVDAGIAQGEMLHV